MVCKLKCLGADCRSDVRVQSACLSCAFVEHEDHADQYALSKGKGSGIFPPMAPTCPFSRVSWQCRHHGLMLYGKLAMFHGLINSYEKYHQRADLDQTLEW
jgi:hypothetical protein